MGCARDARRGKFLSLFRIRVVASNPKNEGQVTEPLDALVDTSTELTWLPAETLWSIGVTPRQKRTFTTADNALIIRNVGYAILRAGNGQETAGEVVFAEPGDRTRLGVRTLQSFGIRMDNPQGSPEKRFIDLATLAAFNKQGQQTGEVKFRIKL